jgi:hypothetical protein
MHAFLCFYPTELTFSDSMVLGDVPCGFSYCKVKIYFRW